MASPDTTHFVAPVVAQVKPPGADVTVSLVELPLTPLQPYLTAYSLIDTIEEFPFAVEAGVR